MPTIRDMAEWNRPTNPPPPREVDLNLDQMRADISKRLLEALVPFLQEIQDLNSLERFMHSQTKQIAARATTTATESGNGHASQGRRTQVRKIFAKRLDKDAAAPVILEIVQAHRDGITSLDLVKRVKAHGGLLDPKMSDYVARAAILSTVKNKLVGQVRAEKPRQGKGEPYHFYPIRNETKHEKVVKAAATAVAKRNGPGGIPLNRKANFSYAELEQNILQHLVASATALSAKELREKAEADGLRHREMTNLHSRKLRELVADKKIKRHDIKNGLPVFSPIRPRVSVSHEPDSEAEVPVTGGD